MVVAPIAAGQRTTLDDLLTSMNTQPGVCDPSNALVPFGEFARLHFARFVILDDATRGDLAAFRQPHPPVPTYLVFMGDCDGPGDVQLAEIAQRAATGLRRIFATCEDFDPAVDLLAWMMAHDLPVAARYVNWLGRTVQQVREEHALQRALTAHTRRAPFAVVPDPQAVRQDLRDHVTAEQQAGRLPLTAPSPTPLAWQLRNLLHVIGLPSIALLALPFFIVLSPLLIAMLRKREASDPEFCPRPDAVAVRTMQQQEDHDVTNPFTALGAVKAGRFRRWLLIVLLLALDYTARHIFTRGHLTRVQTIHFARWVFLDDKTRVVFCSNYDGSHESYMDDFINKVAWGLNIVFSNGFGWPHTDWLVARGARREVQFKHYQRRHQLPTQVWYKAYPGLTASELWRNARIREGLERERMSDAEVREWLRLL